MDANILLRAVSGNEFDRFWKPTRIKPTSIPRTYALSRRAEQQRHRRYRPIVGIARKYAPASDLLVILV